MQVEMMVAEATEEVDVAAGEKAVEMVVVARAMVVMVGHSVIQSDNNLYWNMSHIRNPMSMQMLC